MAPRGVANRDEAAQFLHHAAVSGLPPADCGVGCEPSSGRALS
jgi:hypothetical protein